MKTSERAVDLYLWRDLLKAGYGPEKRKGRSESATTRAVLYTLNLWFQGDSDAFPSTKTIAASSGLSEKSVCTHLELASKSGWLQTLYAGKNGQGWKLHKYRIAIPPGEYVLKQNGERYKVIVEGTEKGSAPYRDKALNEVRHVTKKGTEPDAERTEPNAKGAEPDNTKALNEIQSNTSVNTSVNTSKNSISYSAIIDYLNQKTGKKFKPVESNLKFIKARISEGHTEKDLKTVIDRKVREWAGTKMQQYLRPSTLFNAEKFNQYVGEFDQPLPQELANEVSGRTTTRRENHATVLQTIDRLHEQYIAEELGE